MAYKLKFAFAVLGTAIASLVMYVLLHESGHALVGILCGASNIKISIISAHTSWWGGSFNAITDSLCNVAGSVLPVCISWIAMIFYSKDRKILVYQMAYAVFFTITAASVLSWVCLPVCSMFAALPETDDVTKFLNSSGISPVLVSLTGIIIIVFSIVIAIKKRLFHTYVQLVKDVGYGRTNDEVEQLFSNKSMSGVAASVLIAAFITVQLELSAIEKPIISFTAKNEVPETATYKTFDIQQEKIYNFQTRIDAQGLLAVVSISDKAKQTVFQNLLFNQSDSNSSFPLSPDTYTLSVTFLTDIDMCERYCSAMGYNFADWEREGFTSVYEREPHLTDFFVQLK